MCVCVCVLFPAYLPLPYLNACPDSRLVCSLDSVDQVPTAARLDPCFDDRSTPYYYYYYLCDRSSVNLFGLDSHYRTGHADADDNYQYLPIDRY